MLEVSPEIAIQLAIAYDGVYNALLYGDDARKELNVPEHKGSEAEQSVLATTYVCEKAIQGLVEIAKILVDSHVYSKLEW